MNRSQVRALPSAEAGFVVPLLVGIGAIIAASLLLGMVFRTGVAWWESERAETQRRSDAAHATFLASTADTGEAMELLDLVKRSGSTEVKVALRSSMADDRLTNGEAMTLRNLVNAERDKAERLSAQAHLKRAAQL